MGIAETGGRVQGRRFGCMILRLRYLRKEGG
jgi:hypothetical protein